MATTCGGEVLTKQKINSTDRTPYQEAKHSLLSHFKNQFDFFKRNLIQITTIDKVKVVVFSGCDFET